MKRTEVPPVSMVNVEVPRLKVPAVTDTLPLEVMAEVSALIVPPVWVKPTQLTAAAFSVRVPFDTSSSRLAMWTSVTWARPRPSSAM